MHYQAILTLMVVPMVLAEIYIPSRGRSCQLLQLFDQRVQQTRPFFLVDMAYASLQLTDEAYGGQEQRSVVIKSFTEYVDSTNLASDAKLDLLLSIFEGGMEAQGGFTSTTHSSSKTMYAFIELTQNKRIQKINICDKSFVDKIKVDLINSTDIHVTHAIVGKVLGLKIEVILQVENINNESQAAFEQQFRTELGGFLGKVGFKGGIQTNSSSVSRSVLSRSKITTYCNLVNCPQAPQTIKDLESYVTLAYENVDSSTDMEGNVISYMAYDLKEIAACHKLNVEVVKQNEVSLELVNEIEYAMKEIDIKVKLVVDFVSQFEISRICIPRDVYDKVEILSEQTKSYVHLFTTRLRNTVINVRLGKRKPEKIRKKVETLKNHSTYPGKVIKSLNSDFGMWEKKIQFYQSFGAFNISCLPVGSTLLNLYPISRDRDQYFFFTHNDTTDGSKEYRDALSQFVDICKNQCSGNCDCFFVDCDMGFDFCKNGTAGQIFKYSNGAFSVSGSLIAEVRSSNEIDNLRNAIAYLYLGNARTLRVAKMINSKVDLNHNDMGEVLKSKLGVDRKLIQHDDMTKLFDDDTVGRTSKNRTRKNPVEIFVGNFVDVAP